MGNSTVSISSGRRQGRTRAIAGTIRRRPATSFADALPSAFSLGASGDTVATGYAANDAPLSITLAHGSTLQKFSYAAEPSGGVASETDLPSGALSPSNYTYDAQSQATSRSRSSPRPNVSSR